MWYYAGLASFPKLVYRTGKKAWIKPTGPEGYRQLKELRAVFGHKINVAWPDLGPKVCDLVNSHKIRWTFIDVARSVVVGDGEVAGPPVLWIGVRPDTLQGAGEVAFNAANDLLDLLATFGITDVKVEYRESVYTRSVGRSRALRSVSNLNPTVDVRGPLTPALGLPIAASARPDAQGTMALYFAEGGHSDKVLVLPVVTSSSRQARKLTTTTSSQVPVRLVSTSSFSAPERSRSSSTRSR
jgi:hypothetical protein